MTIRMAAGAAIVALGLGLPGSASAQGLQPGMRTMIQQGGIEPGPLLGAVLPGYGYAPGFGFIPEDAAYDDPRWRGPDDAPRYVGRRARGYERGLASRHHASRRVLRVAHPTRHHFVR